MWGGKVFANWLRRARFNDAITQTILREIKADKSLVDDLIGDVSGKDKTLLQEALTDGE